MAIFIDHESYDIRIECNVAYGKVESHEKETASGGGAGRQRCECDQKSTSLGETQ